MEIISVIIGAVFAALMPNMGFVEFGLIIGPISAMIAYFILWCVDFQIRKITGKIARESKYKFGTFSTLVVGISLVNWYFLQKELFVIPQVYQGIVYPLLLIITFVVIYIIWAINDGLIDHYRFLPDKE